MKKMFLSVACLLLFTSNLISIYASEKEVLKSNPMCADIDKSEIEDSTTIITQGEITDKDENNQYPNAKNPKYTLYDNGHLDISGGVFRTNQAIIRLENSFQKNFNIKLRSITIGSSLLPEDKVLIANVRDIFNFQSLSVIKIKIGNVDVSEIRDMSWMFNLNYCLESLDLGDNFNTSQVNNMQAMFASLSELETLRLGNNFNTSNVEDMSSMFEGLSKLKQLDLGDKFDTSNVFNMSSVFAGMKSLESLDLGTLFNTSKATYMSALFADLKSIKTLDLGDFFNTSKVTNMRQMFLGMRSIVNLDLGDNFDTSSVIDMHSMFKEMENLETLDLGDEFDTSKVETIEMMFEGNQSLKKLDLKEKFFFNEKLNVDGMFKGAHFKEFIISNPIYNFNRTGLDTNINSSEYGSGWVMRENPRIKYQGNDEFMNGYDPYNPNHLGTYVKPKTSFVSYSNDPDGTGKYNFGDVFKIRTAPVYTDYIFIDWYYNGKSYYENNEFIMPEHNVYFDAGYAPKTYKITFVNKDGYHLLDYLIKSLDDKVTILEGPALKGHTFRSWTYRDREYFEGDIHLVEREDITFVANYDVNKYDVSFIDVDGNTLFNSLNLDYGTKFTLPDPELIKGYTFKGWMSDGVLYNANETLELSDSDKSFTAVYEINKYEVNFINESNIKLFDSLNLEYGSEFSLPDHKIVKGYTFKSWKNDDLMYNPGDIISLGDSDLSFVAIYDVNQYDVSFINKDNEALFETLSLDYGSKYTLPNPGFIKGYTFVGWLSEGVIYNANSSITLSDSDKVYIAQYEKERAIDRSNQANKDSNSKFVDTGLNDISTLLVIVISISVLSLVILKRRKVNK